MCGAIRDGHTALRASLMSDERLSAQIAVCAELIIHKVNTGDRLTMLCGTKFLWFIYLLVG